MSQYERPRLSFLHPSYAEHEVNGETLHFYSTSPFQFLKLRAFAAPVAKLFCYFVTQGQVDKLRGRSARELVDPNGLSIEHLAATDPIDPKVLAQQQVELDGRMHLLVGVFTDEKQITAICELLVDSLREEFPDRKNEAANVAALKEDIDLGSMFQMLVGLAKGNAARLDPLFGGSLSTALQGMKKKMSKTVTDWANEKPEQEKDTEHKSEPETKNDPDETSSTS